MFSGTLAYPIQFEDSVLYVFVSDNAQDEKIDFRDNATGANLMLDLPAGGAALVLLGKKEKNVIDSYSTAQLLQSIPLRKKRFKSLVRISPM